MRLSKISLNAITMQYLLMILCIGLIGAILWVSLLANNILTTKATEVDHIHIDAELVQQELVGLQGLKTSLDENSELVKKTNEVVSIASQYKFQDQVIQDLSAYAEKANVSIVGYDFGSTPGAKVVATPQAGAQTAAPTPANIPPKTLVTVRLQNDVPYTNFLKFLMSIEQNVTKMQLTGITLQPIDKNPNNIQGPIIELEVFIQ